MKQPVATNEKAQCPMGSSSRGALLVALLAFGGCFFHNYRQHSETITHPQLRKDSLQYYRDALVLQHRLFAQGVDEAGFVRSQFDALGLTVPNEGEVSFNFGDKLLHSLYCAALLQAFDGNVSAVCWSNLLAAALAAGLAAFCLAREFGLIAGAIGIIATLLVSTGATIPTLLLEPNIALALTLLAFGGWLVLRGRESLPAVGFLAVICILALLLKSALTPFAWLGAAVSGWGFVHRLRARRAGHSPSAIRTVACALIAIGLIHTTALGAQELLKTRLRLGDEPFRTNGPYALWMGSLPTEWTGAYSGRISTHAFRFILDERADPQYRHQGNELWRRGGYWITMAQAGPYILDNYLNHPIDALERITFRYTKLMRIQGFANPAHAVVGWLSLVGCIAVVLTRRHSLLPWVLMLQGAVWMHALSRYRDRDEELILPLVGFTAAVGAVCLLRLLRRNGRDGLVAGADPRLPCWAACVLLAILLVPIVSVILFPRTQSLAPPVIREIAYRLDETDGGAFELSADIGGPHRYARLGARKGRETSYWLSQADQAGRVRFRVPRTEAQLPEGFDKIGLEAWSFTGVSQSIAITEAHRAREDSVETRSPVQRRVDP